MASLERDVLSLTILGSITCCFNLFTLKCRQSTFIAKYCTIDWKGLWVAANRSVCLGYYFWLSLSRSFSIWPSVFPLPSFFSFSHAFSRDRSSIAHCGLCQIINNVADFLSFYHRIINYFRHLMQKLFIIQWKLLWKHKPAMLKKYVYPVYPVDPLSSFCIHSFSLTNLFVSFFCFGMRWPFQWFGSHYLLSQITNSYLNVADQSTAFTRHWQSFQSIELNTIRP